MKHNAPTPHLLVFTRGLGMVNLVSPSAWYFLYCYSLSKISCDTRRLHSGSWKTSPRTNDALFGENGRDALANLLDSSNEVHKGLTEWWSSKNHLVVSSEFWKSVGIRHYICQFHSCLRKYCLNAVKYMQNNCQKWK